jgi:hypothetical protein
MPPILNIFFRDNHSNLEKIEMETTCRTMRQNMWMPHVPLRHHLGIIGENTGHIRISSNIRQWQNISITVYPFITPQIPFISMSSTTSSLQKQKRISSKYTYEERKVLHPFKKEYRSQPNKPERAKMFRETILPAICNYWRDNGNDPVNEGDLSGRVKVFRKSLPHPRYFLYFLVQKLGAWLTNNWRPNLTQESTTKLRIRYTAIDHIWFYHRGLVEKELKKMLGLKELDFAKKRVFGQRTAAAKNVFEIMTVGEREEIKATVERYKKTGLPAEIQR